MLTLTRREGESIIIGDAIAIMVTSIQASRTKRRVRVAIEAHSSVPVHRHEIFRQIHELPENVDDPVRLLQLYHAARRGLDHPALARRSELT